MKIQNKVRQILKRAKLLVNSGWCRGTEAKGRNGKPVDATSPHAYRFCATGAVVRAAHDLKYGKMQAELSVRTLDNTEGYFGSAVALNDQCSSKRKVLELFDAAIESSTIS